MIYLIIGLLVLIAIYLIATYNFFVSSKARIKAAIQEIGNQLKRQAGLIPNLEASAKGYIKHESGIFEKLTQARMEIASATESGDAQKMADAGAKLASVLPTLKIAVEDNPELRASEAVSQLMEELRDTADKIMFARRLVIDLAADYNVRRVTFPSSIVASTLGFSDLPGLITPESGEHVEVSKDEMETPKVNL